MRRRKNEGRKPRGVGDCHQSTDERITSRVPEMAEAMKRAGKQFESKIYQGAGHGFFNDTGERYDAAAAKDAWARTLAFLRTTLR